MSLFDLHAHPALKSYLGSDKEEDRKSCWEIVDVHGFWGVVDALIGNILDSQIALKQAKASNLNVIVSSFYPVESPLIKGKIGPEVVTDIISWLIPRTRITLLGVSKRLPLLSNALLEKIVQGEVSYYEMLNDLMLHMRNASKDNSLVNFPNSFDEIHPDRINIITAIEGGHIFFGHDNSYSEEEIFNRILRLRKGQITGQEAEGTYCFLYITLNHLINLPIANQAYGMKMIDSAEFIPQGDGFTPLGIRMLDKLLNKDEAGKPIIIDIKHLSLKARKQFYQIRREKYSHLPFIVSHGGVTGCSWEHLPVRRAKRHVENGHKCMKVIYAKPVGLKDTTFNPWSVNFYDEEIREIVNSKGMFGIILDERIIGSHRIDPEYFSIEEYEEIKNKRENKATVKRWKRQNRVVDRRSRDLFVSRSEKHLHHFCNNLLHIVKVAGEQAWEHVCVGSDFDGMIESVSFCSDASKMDQLATQLKSAILKMVDGKEADYYVNNQNIEDRIEGVLYRNGMRFLEEWFQ